jgi:predicted GNAT family acetyltransferase
MTSAGDASIQVIDEPNRQRYEARLGDRVVGFAEYRAVRGRLIMFHTEVDPAFEGRGVGGRLASGALDDIRARGLKVTVKCPFIGAFIQRHPEYQDLRAEREAPANRLNR